MWSFGTTMWEILSAARDQPLSELTDQEVIECLGRCYAGDWLDDIFPCQPDHCPREIYDLMRECWHRDEDGRPTFKEIQMFLRRKTIGFIPGEQSIWQNNY